MNTGCCRVQTVIQQSIRMTSAWKWILRTGQTSRQLMQIVKRHLKRSCLTTRHRRRVYAGESLTKQCILFQVASECGIPLTDVFRTVQESDDSLWLANKNAPDLCGPMKRMIV